MPIIQPVKRVLLILFLLFKLVLVLLTWLNENIWRACTVPYVCRVWKWSSNRYILCILCAAAALIVAYVLNRQQQMWMAKPFTVAHGRIHTFDFKWHSICVSTRHRRTHSRILMHPMHAHTGSTIISFNNAENIVVSVKFERVSILTSLH